MEPAVTNAAVPKRQALKKHVAAVWATGLPRNARLVWNALTYHAYPSLPYADEFAVPIERLMEVLDSESKNTDHLKRTLDLLVRTTVQWDILGLSGEEIEWGTHGMLSGAQIRSGQVIYRYDKPLRQALYEPERWAIIDLLLQVTLSGKYAVGLLEMIIHAYDLNAGVSKCPWIELRQLRELLGADSSMYEEFKYLNRDVIKPSLDQINSKTDFQVKMKRRGRPVSHVRFDITSAKTPKQVTQRAHQKRAEQENEQRALEVGGQPRESPSRKVKTHKNVPDLLARLPERVRKSVVAAAMQRIETDLKRNEALRDLLPTWKKHGINDARVNKMYLTRLELVMSERNLIPH